MPAKPVLYAVPSFSTAWLRDHCGSPVSTQSCSVQTTGPIAGSASQRRRELHESPHVIHSQ